MAVLLGTIQMQMVLPVAVVVLVRWAVMVRVVDLPVMVGLELHRQSLALL
jgi:hypothetical protein